ncbi:methionyl-tRNA formyltransferase [Bradyrhizobium acaciae]|uniref:methionyl-tRNA formyltransferase n=1 Tax=Bradyrhizobium acaciae TaxID=2683706 RepID=UPI001E650979|nr:formyltransferase family protein [Bradyrhizobium acaciae]MCC8980673.1 hypothetical protein [Bradyrhizobium acaciae]
MSLQGAKVLYVTCAENGLHGLAQLTKAGIDVAAVVTIPPQLATKYLVSGYVDVSPWCLEHGLKCIQLREYKIEVADVAAIDFDLLIVNGWNRLIPSEVFSRARLGALGIHAGHPPLGLGRAPLVWNIIHGQSDIEVFVFRLTAQADDGDIMAAQVVEITEHDDVKTLYEKVMDVGADLFLTAIRKLQAGEGGHSQDRRFVSHYPKRTEADGLIDFTMTDRQICDFVRAQVPPYPGAFTYLGSERWKVLRVQRYDRFLFRDIPRIPGRILRVLPSGVVVQTGAAPIWIRRAEVDGADVDPMSRSDIVGRRFGDSVD